MYNSRQARIWCDSKLHECAIRNASNKHTDPQAHDICDEMDYLEIGLDSREQLWNKLVNLSWRICSDIL